MKPGPATSTLENTLFSMEGRCASRASLGDCLAAVLDWSGYDVTREFYINDAGNQIQKFGKSLAIRYLQLYKGEDACPLPEECYQGADIIARAKEFAEVHSDAYVNKDFDELKKGWGWRRRTRRYTSCLRPRRCGHIQGWRQRRARRW